MPTHLYLVNVEAAILKDEQYLMVIRGEHEAHAPGVLTFPGGKVEDAGLADGILEATLRREILEEVGLQVDTEMIYLESKSFLGDDGQAVVDVVFLCRHASGAPVITDPGELAAIHWLTAQEILTHPKTPAWTGQSIEMAEAKRLELGW